MWTEDFEAETFYRHFEAFDKLYDWGMLIGEMVWNFADFLTPQGKVSFIYLIKNTTVLIVQLEIIRPTGCMKGVFTRNRQPKMAAYVLRQRYWQLAHKQCTRNFKGKIKNDPISI